uniref:Peptidase S8/S53 domain-containing protein n=1 Tax=Panagrolaimus davidi TaxID=227884 RepID=A0A914QHK0_9BILA
MIEEHGIIITQAATNLGPCFFSTYLTLSNVSELLDQIFIIGSVFTEEMKKKIPFHESKNYPSLYNLSSKGPLQISGARGIDFVAPGAAITDFPKWFSNKNRISGGTSSATPNAAGTIACLLSALKANGIPYSPSMIKFALANTAFLPKNANKLEFGNGIIQIFDAFEFIKKFVNYFSQKPIVPRFLDEPNQRGIIFVKNEKNLSKDYLINIDLEVDKNWILKCAESGKNFIQHSKTFKNNSFNVKIDTNLLEEGSINYAEIYGIDYSNLSFGPLFYVPITVICPAAANFFIDKIITIKPGSPIHFFIKTPPSKLEYCSIGITPFGYKPKMSCFPYSPLTCECRQNMGTRWIKKNFIFNFFENKIVENMRLKENCEKYFEICFYHYESVSLSFKMEINFLQAFYK